MPINKVGKVLVPEERKREQSIHRVLLKRAEQAGVERFSCQNPRRTFVTRLLESGADIFSTAHRADCPSRLALSRDWRGAFPKLWDTRPPLG